MPPKQVYGKRAKKTTESYARLLSSPLLKDDAVAGVEKGLSGMSLKENHADDENEEEWGYSRTKARKGRAKQKTVVLDSEDEQEEKDIKGGKNERDEGRDEMEKLFRRLDLQPHQEPTKEKDPDDTSRRGSSKVAVAVVIPAKERQKSLSSNGEILNFQETETRPDRAARNALENRDANAVSKRHKSKGQNGKKKEERVSPDTQDKEKHTTRPRQTSIENDNDPTPAVKPEPNDRTGDGDVPLPSTPAPSSMAKAKRSKRKDAQTPKVYAEDVYSRYVKPLLALSDEPCILSFDEWAQTMDDSVDVEKIAEASFSEVYRLTVKDEIPGGVKESVLKVVGLRMPPDAPLPSECTHTDRPRRKGDQASKTQLKKERQKREEDDEWKSHVQDVLGEVRLLQNLNYIPGFTVFRGITVLQGRPSTSFSHAWKEWNKARPRGKKSHYPDPSKKASYEDTQLWAVIEMDDAGTDCGKVIEAGGITTIWEVWDIFWGICLSVAKAEEACRFEHRDMHMDNICIRYSSKGDTPLTKPRVTNPLKRKLGFTGLETTVIDYTLSRADIISDFSRRSSFMSQSEPCPDSAPTLADIAYLDLNKDPSLFEGDAEEEYQYEIYRYMWGAVFHNDPLNQDQVDIHQRPSTPEPNNYGPETPRRSPRKHNPAYKTPANNRKPAYPTPPPDENIWKHFHPKTNLVWAHFILHELLKRLEECGNEPVNLTLDELLESVCGSGVNSAEDEERIQRKAILMHKALVKVAQLLDPGSLGRKSRLGCMGDLVILALESKWLNVREVTGEGAG